MTARLVSSELVEDGGLLAITLDNPKGNILSSALMKELDGVLESHAGQRSLKLVLVKASGKNFSFGAAVEEHVRDEAPQMLEIFHGLVRRIADYPVATAALVNGRCLGGAFELALACHFVLAACDARFACPEIKLGVFPPVLAVLGPARLGAAASERLLLTGAELSAETGHALGFVAALGPAGEASDAWARDWYRENLAPLSAFSLRQGVAAAREGWGCRALLAAELERAERRYLDRLMRGADPNEGIAAFLERRRPRWVNA